DEAVRGRYDRDDNLARLELRHRPPPCGRWPGAYGLRGRWVTLPGFVCCQVPFREAPWMRRRTASACAVVNAGRRPLTPFAFTPGRGVGSGFLLLPPLATSVTCSSQASWSLILASSISS